MLQLRIDPTVLGFFCLLIMLSDFSKAQHSVARRWNEVLLQGIRNDLARPTVHARNLFHISAAMYDAWAAYEPTAYPWLLGQVHRGYYCRFDGIPTPSDPADLEAAREEAISYAAFNLISHRFRLSPGVATTVGAARALMEELGYDTAIINAEYESGSAAALGNYIAQSMIEFGLQDGANEADDYGNRYYQPVNPALLPKESGNPSIVDPNRWQPLVLDVFIDQSGNPIPVGMTDFQSPEWGRVIPFALNTSHAVVHEREEGEYWVFHDPGPPPYIQEDGAGQTAEYQWGFSLVALWGSHLDPNDGVMIDISPGSIGNIQDFPETVEGLRSFYDQLEGGDPGQGHDLNPHTGMPYVEQIVPRADYCRVLAEFWADGPDSETPPGHWFTILNYVNDHPDFVKKYRGEGPVVDDLEWDVKAYFALGGAVHDAAICAWGAKGWYDYIRPVSAIRYMADRGQSTDMQAPNYTPDGIPLITGFIEQIAAGDPLAGTNGENIGKIKLYSWKGPDYIQDPETDLAGVGWILAEEWWPYQRPTFVTPPFAGYVSGHSTFSRAAAEVMTLLTGDAYFPGGLGEFQAKKNEFLVFEEGPSVDLTLQWATYRDASDQTSLSRIWGGIHPPADDIPGRLMGEKIGVKAFQKAERFFNGTIVTGLNDTGENDNTYHLYPNPVRSGDDLTIQIKHPEDRFSFELLDARGKLIKMVSGTGRNVVISTEGLGAGLYLVRKLSKQGAHDMKLIIN